MNMPGMAGEASVYKTNSQYRSTGGKFLIDANTNVVPQACGLATGIKCGAIFAVLGVGCTLLCIDAWAAGPPGYAACAGCWAAQLGSSYGQCKDCLPDWIRSIIHLFESGGDGGHGGGGGGPPPPPPVCDGVRCLPGQICCRCENVGAECLSAGLCDRLCRQPGGPAL
jgi:hypothetical protein